MGHKILDYGIEWWGYQELLVVETYGDLKYMPRNAQMVWAIYGCFERTNQKTLLYTATILRERSGEIGHCPDSEYLDDYYALKAGNIEILY
jgi:hypothetical protein